MTTDTRLQEEIDDQQTLARVHARSQVYGPTADGPEALVGAVLDDRERLARQLTEAESRDPLPASVARTAGRLNLILAQVRKIRELVADGDVTAGDFMQSAFDPVVELAELWGSDLDQASSDLKEIYNREQERNLRASRVKS